MLGQPSPEKEAILKKLHDYKHGSEARFYQILPGIMPHDWVLECFVEEILKPLQEENAALKAQL
jgi:hypothetical protein